LTSSKPIRPNDCTLPIASAAWSPDSDSGSDPPPICTALKTPSSPRAWSTRFSHPSDVPGLAVPRSQVSIASKWLSVLSGVPTACTTPTLPDR
jgi:hypothetical protein